MFPGQVFGPTAAVLPAPLLVHLIAFVEILLRDVLIRPVRVVKEAGYVVAFARVLFSGEVGKRFHAVNIIRLVPHFLDVELLREEFVDLAPIFLEEPAQIEGLPALPRVPFQFAHGRAEVAPAQGHCVKTRLRGASDAVITVEHRVLRAVDVRPGEMVAKGCVAAYGIGELKQGENLLPGLQGNGFKIEHGLPAPAAGRRRQTNGHEPLSSYESGV